MKNLFSKYGVTIKDEKLLKEALTHSSYSNEHGGTCYERLEYLGDAVLEIVCSEYLFRTTDKQEGEMSKLRSLYVCENALFEYSKSINLKDYILLGNGIDEPNKTIIADVFEAVMAVVYLESGISAVKKIFNSLIVPHIESHDDFLKDYKTLLQESVQTVKKSVTYNLIGESGPAHKKSAEQEAAKKAYMKRAK